MTTDNARAATSTGIAVTPTGLVAGAAGGLAAGAVFGVLMQVWDMLPMVAMLVGKETTAVGVGWVAHLAISVFLGAGFAVVRPRLRRG